MKLQKIQTLMILALAMLTVPALVFGKDMKDQTKSSAVAVLHGLEGHKISGTLVFEHTSDHQGIKVTGTIEGLPKNSVHGFHIHEFGDCSAEDGTSAGGHFDPTGAKHGAPAAKKSHVGDLGNIRSNKNGVATISVMKKGAMIGHGKNDILGRGVIVHAKADDLKSQPTGAAGARIACGVIGVKK